MFGLRILCLALGYLFGCFQTAYILGRMKGIDIREYGSGNAGTTNAIRVLGTKAGLLVFAGDMLKCLIALLLVGALFGKCHPEAVYLLKSWAFMGVVLGHDFPFYMNFKGGKGVQYSRPEVWRDKKVPAVLLSGDHAKVDRWRKEQSLERTRLRRPDLYEKYMQEHPDAAKYCK